MVDRHFEILNGELSFPKQIMKLLKPNEHQEANILNFWNNVWFNFLKEKPTDTISWYNTFNDSNMFNSMLLRLSKSGWITSEVDYDYANITLNKSKLLRWVTEEELINVKYWYKFSKYRLKKTKSTLKDMVQINGKHRPTGLIREGFMKAGNSTFCYDTKYITKYMKGIVFNLQKGLSASTKDITYQEVIEELTNYYSVDGTEYTLGNCYIDSRGRSIFQCSKKIFNPVSSKDARALLKCKAEELTEDGWNCIYAAISELLSYSGKNYKDKVKYGQSSYILRTMPSYTDMEINKNFNDLYKLIWLERMYNNIDTYDTTGWCIPIELDRDLSSINFSNCWKLLRALGTKCNNPKDWTISSQAA